MSGHTSVPWSLKEHTGKEYGKPGLCSHAVMGADGLQIATVVSDCVDGFEANARLIAAAPELLEALQRVVAVADRATDAFDAARAAIAKATQA